MSVSPLFGAWRKRNRTTLASRRTLLFCEQLEFRWIPATFRWERSLISLDHNWNNGTNWYKKNETTGVWRMCAEGEYPGKPGSSDDVIFVGGIDEGRDVYCNVNISPTLHSMTIKDGYSSPIMIRDGNTITISGSDAKSELRMDSAGGGVITGDRVNNGQMGNVIIDGKAGFFFRSGSLENLLVEVKRGATSQASMVIAWMQGAVGPSLKSVHISVGGRLEWQGADVNCQINNLTPAVNNVIHILHTGEFDITAAGYILGGTAAVPRSLDVVNDGTTTLNVNAEATATIVGNYTNHGTTRLKSGTLVLDGLAEQKQPTSSFQLLNGSRVAIANPGVALGIRDGRIIGDGTVQGSLVLGHDPTQPNPPAATTPVIAPGDSFWETGTINVTGNFQMFSGEMIIQIAGPATDEYDRVRVTGYAALSGKLVGKLLQDHKAINANAKIKFLTYASRPGDADFTSFDMGLLPGWGRDKNATEYWFFPHMDVPRAAGKVKGMAWQDNGGVAGMFDPGIDGVRAGVTVRLLRDGAVVATATTWADGRYEFADLDPGGYHVEFGDVADRRFARPDAGYDLHDSDVDPLTGLAEAPVWNFPVVDGVNAGYFENTDPVATADPFAGVEDTPVAGDVLANDTDADGDVLTAALASGPAHGTVTLNSDGTFTYTPNTGWTGTDSFTYTLDDGYGGTATATVTLAVAEGATAGGSIWNDANGDGVRDAGEGGAGAGIRLWLLDANGDVVDAVETDANGNYAFTNLAAGDYEVVLDPPAGFTFAPPDEGGDDSLDSDFDSSGSSGLVTVSAGGTLDLDAGLVAAA